MESTIARVATALRLSVRIAFGAAILAAVAPPHFAQADDSVFAYYGFGPSPPAVASPLPPMAGSTGSASAPALLPGLGMQRASQVAFMQADNQPPLPPTETLGQPPSSQTAPLGTAPVDNSEVFLSEETVLLRPGEWQVTYGAEYLWQEANTVVTLTGGDLGLERLRLRQLFAPLDIRYGWSENIQPYVHLSAGGALFEYSDADSDSFHSVGGLGDVSAGFSYLLAEHSQCTPDIILQCGFTAPTGANPFKGLLDVTTFGDVPSLGIGTWAVTTNLSFVKEVDPVVMFGGIGYTHEFETTIDGQQIRPGEIATYQFGVGYAVNDIITFSTVFQGAVQTSMKVNDDWIGNSSREPFAIQLAMTVALSPCSFVEPFIRYGLDSDAPQADFGVYMIRQF